MAIAGTPDRTAAAAPQTVLLSIGGLYVAQSVIGGMTWQALPAVMRAQGLPLDQIGWLALIALPWVLKFLWAPMVERYRLPLSGIDRTATVVLVGGLISALGLVAVGWLGLASLLPVMGILTLVAFAASTVDIACDGYAVQALARQDHSWGNAAQVGGAYLGSAIGTGLFLVLVDRLGWSVSTLIMAGLLILLGLPFMLWRVNVASMVDHSRAPALRVALRRPEIRRGLLAAAIYVAAQKASMGLVGALMVDKGIDLATIGIANGAGSMFVGLAAALAGGWMARNWGIRFVLVLALLLQSAAFGFFAWYAWSGAATTAMLITVAIASGSAIMALGFVALYAQFMRWSDPNQAGVDFTLFQCMDALVSMIAAVIAGYVAQYFGYGVFFAISAALAILAAPAIARVADAS